MAAIEIVFRMVWQPLKALRDKITTLLVWVVPINYILGYIHLHSIHISAFIFSPILLFDKFASSKIH